VKNEASVEADFPDGGTEHGPAFGRGCAIAERSQRFCKFMEPGFREYPVELFA
jgi:hypothetical protein